MNTIASRATGYCTRAGRILTTPSSMLTAHLLKGRSLYVKCRAMPTPRGGQVQRWPPPSGGPGQAEDFISQAVMLRTRFDRMFWCEELVNLRIGSGR